MSCWVDAVEKIYDKELVSRYLKQTPYEENIGSLKEKLLIVRYEKGEFISSPLQSEHLFLIVIHGTLHVYCIRDDGTVHSLSSGQDDYILGDMDIFSEKTSSVYAEADTELLCLALSLDENKAEMLDNIGFLRLICSSLTRKMQQRTTLEAVPVSLKERVLSYMKYRCPCNELKGIEQTASRLNCSSRQLQRILNKYETDGVVMKIGKGAYKLV